MSNRPRRRGLGLIKQAEGYQDYLPSVGIGAGLGGLAGGLSSYLGEEDDGDTTLRKALLGALLGGGIGGAGQYLYNRVPAAQQALQDGAAQASGAAGNAADKIRGLLGGEAQASESPAGAPQAPQDLEAFDSWGKAEDIAGGVGQKASDVWELLKQLRAGQQAAQPPMEPANLWGGMQDAAGRVGQTATGAVDALQRLQQGQQASVDALGNAMSGRLGGAGLEQLRNSAAERQRAELAARTQQGAQQRQQMGASSVDDILAEKSVPERAEYVVGDLANRAMAPVEEVAGRVGSAVGGAADQVAQGAKQYGRDFVEGAGVVGDAASDLYQGAKGGLNQAVEGAKGYAGDVAGGAQELAKTPGNLMDQLGDWWSGDPNYQRNQAQQKARDEFVKQKSRNFWENR